MSSDPLQVRHNREHSRYEVELDGQRAIIQYRDSGGLRYYLHTEVPEELEGHGIASVMARAALDEAQAAGLTIVPLCPFVRGYIEKHPQYKALVKS
jgi:predicted GNAT family acetyltransferase